MKLIGYYATGPIEMQLKFFNLVFKPTWLGVIVTAACIPIFIKLGLWQYHKATLKQEIQTAYQHSASKGAVNLNDFLTTSESLQYQKVTVQGQYVPQYQILVDNQVENERAGFHVLTPLKINNTSDYVLVNRGWIVANDQHDQTPIVNTPAGQQTIVGMAWVPTKKIFTLEDTTQQTSTDTKWQMVWQHLDMQKYQKTAPIKVLPIIIKLDPASQAGGFVRNWQAPIDRVMTNLSYAYQWFGFAVAALAIFLYMSFSRIKANGQS